MTPRSYFGKMNLILGSVVPLAMFLTSAFSSEKSEALAFLLWCTFAFLWLVTFLLWILHLIEKVVIRSSRTRDFRPSLKIWSVDQKLILKQSHLKRILVCSFVGTFLKFILKDPTSKGTTYKLTKQLVWSSIHLLERWQNLWRMYESISQFLPSLVITRIF